MDEYNEKLLAVEALIYKFAAEQFEMSQITSIDAMLIMKSITAEFNAVCLRESIYKRIHFNEPSVKAKQAVEEELKRAIEETEVAKEGNADDC